MKLYRFLSSEELTMYLDGERIEPRYRWYRGTGDSREYFVSFLDEEEFLYMSEKTGRYKNETRFDRSLRYVVSGDILAAFSTTKAFLKKASVRRAEADYAGGMVYEYHADFYDDSLLKLDWYVDADTTCGLEKGAEDWKYPGKYPVDMAKCARYDRKRRDAIKQKRARKMK